MGSPRPGPGPCAPEPGCPPPGHGATCGRGAAGGWRLRCSVWPGEPNPGDGSGRGRAGRAGAGGGARQADPQSEREEELCSRNPVLPRPPGAQGLTVVTAAPWPPWPGTAGPPLASLAGTERPRGRRCGRLLPTPGSPGACRPSTRHQGAAQLCPRRSCEWMPVGRGLGTGAAAWRETGRGLLDSGPWCRGVGTAQSAGPGPSGEACQRSRGPTGTGDGTVWPAERRLRPQGTRVALTPAPRPRSPPPPPAPRRGSGTATSSAAWAAWPTAPGSSTGACGSAATPWVGAPPGSARVWLRFPGALARRQAERGARLKGDLNPRENAPRGSQAPDLRGPSGLAPNGAVRAGPPALGAPIPGSPTHSPARSPLSLPEPEYRWPGPAGASSGAAP